MIVRFWYHLCRWYFARGNRKNGGQRAVQNKIPLDGFDYVDDSILVLYVDFSVRTSD